MALYQQVQQTQLTKSAGGFYSGQANQAPFNPYAGPVLTAVPVAQPATSFVPIGPQPTAPTIPGVGQHVVYAHYAPGQAVAGQAATTAGGSTTAPAAQPKKDEPKKAEPKKEEPKPTPPPAPEPKTVTVKSGDSLSKIAAANGTTWQKLYELNKDVVGGNPNLIRPGQVLKMP